MLKVVDDHEKRSIAQESGKRVCERHAWLLAQPRGASDGGHAPSPWLATGAEFLSHTRRRDSDQPRDRATCQASRDFPMPRASQC